MPWICIGSSSGGTAGRQPLDRASPARPRRPRARRRAGASSVGGWLSRSRVEHRAPAGSVRAGPAGSRPGSPSSGEPRTQPKGAPRHRDRRRRSGRACRSRPPRCRCCCRASRGRRSTRGLVGLVPDRIVVDQRAQPGAERVDAALDHALGRLQRQLVVLAPRSRATLDSTTRIRSSTPADVQRHQPLRQAHHRRRDLPGSSVRPRRSLAPCEGLPRPARKSIDCNRRCTALLDWVASRMNRRSANAAASLSAVPGVEQRKLRVSPGGRRPRPRRQPRRRQRLRTSGPDRRPRRAGESAARAAAPRPRAARPPGSPRRRARARRCSTTTSSTRSSSISAAASRPPPSQSTRVSPRSPRRCIIAARSSWPSAWKGISISSAPSSVQACAPLRARPPTSWQSQSGISAAVSRQVAVARQRQRPAHHHPHRVRAAAMPEVAHVEPRVVAAHRAGADQHRVGLRAHQVHLGPRPRAGDPAALAGAGGDPAVERGGELQRQHRPPGGRAG